MRTALGDVVVGQLIAPADPPANMGARIEVPYTRQIVSYWQPAVFVDGLDAIGNPARFWQVTLEGPPAVGDYLLVFRTGDPEPPELEVFFPLMVS